MAADFALAFGSLLYSDIPGLTLSGVTRPLSMRIRSADTPARDGGYTAGGKRAPARFSLRGTLTATDADDLRDRYDTLMAAHIRQGIAKFYRHSDRFRYAEFESEGKAEDSAEDGFNYDLDISFFCADPYEYAETASTQTGLAAGGTVTTAGEDYALPALTLVVGSTGSGGTITIANTTTGESVTLTPSATGTYIIDSYDETVTKGGADKRAEVGPGSFLRLAPGVNVLTVTEGGGATTTSLSATWRDRW